MAGLKNIYSRAEIVGGKLEIFSKPERGTTILIHIPINTHKNEKRTN
jgi:signal transduction histidine kinase